jgi:DNA repair protein RadC
MTESRKERLKSILYAIRDLDEFSSEGAKLLCNDPTPAYVTKVIRLLAKDGLLNRVERDNQEFFRWVRNSGVDPDHWIDRHVYGEQIKQSPEQDRPREQLLLEGPSKLSDAQLIAILIRVGIVGESAIQAGRVLANRFGGEKIANLPDWGLAELRAISKTIRKDSYAQIMAGIELGRRIALLRDQKPVLAERIRGSDDAIRYCSRVFARLAVDGKQEEFHIVTLDTQHGPINNHLITVGTLDASLVHPREVFRAAIRDAASAILLVHNHPSGDPTPSREDKAVTERLTQVGEVVGIRVLDHIIVAKERCRSVLAER